MKHNVLFWLFSLSFCYIIVVTHVKAEKNIIIFWAGKQKERTQTVNENQQN